MRFQQLPNENPSASESYNYPYLSSFLGKQLAHYKTVILDTFFLLLNDIT